MNTIFDLVGVLGDLLLFLIFCLIISQFELSSRIIGIFIMMLLLTSMIFSILGLQTLSKESAEFLFILLLSYMFSQFLNRNTFRKRIKK